MGVCLQVTFIFQIILMAYMGGDFTHSSPKIAPDHSQYITSPVRIGKNCWLGEGVIVMPGVTIGDGCVIGAHSGVNKNMYRRR